MIRRMIPVLAAGLLLVGCLGANPPQGDPAAPVLVRGAVSAGTGLPAGTAQLRLVATSWLSAQPPREELPVTFEREYTPHPDGRFELRLWPGDVLRESGGRPASAISFDLLALGADGQVVAAAPFTREVAGSRWDGAAPEVTLRPVR
jgi:hypothetical protein